MNKDELVTELSEKTNLTKTQIKAVLNALPDVAFNELTTKGYFTLPHVVMLKSQERAARSGRNPQTGETITIGAKKVIKAKALHPLNFTITL